MIIEQGTNYAYKLQYMTGPTFDKVRDLSVKFYRELPKPMQDELYEALNRGIDILDSEPQMEAYMHAFGKMHQAKLEYAFDKLPDDFLEEPEINIIDYGCGQALGTMCYADFLRQKGCGQKVKTITLIEPSEICLKRAALNASIFFPNAEIKTVNKSFDELTADDIVCSEETPTLHILSNVLDILDFYLEDFVDLINDIICGYNHFVCVGPFFNYSDKDDRMEEFSSLLNGYDYCNECFDKYEFDEDKSWTANIVCFSIGVLRRQDKRNIYEIDVHNDGSYESPSVGYELDGYSVKLRRADNTYENTDTPIIYLSLSKDYNGQDHLVLSVNSAEELLACNGEQERKAYLLKCEVSYSEEAKCYGIIRHRTQKIICSLDICNDGNYESPSVGYELDGYSAKLRQAANKNYENSNTPIIYLSLSKDYNGQDHIVLSGNSAEELLACNGEQERKAYLLKCEVSYSEEAECYGIIRSRNTGVIYKINICNDGNYESPSVGYELDGYSIKLQRADNTYENTDTPIIYLSLSKDYNGQDHIVLSVNSAEELLACNGEQERKAYLLKCEVSYSEEAECYGIIRSRNTGVIYKINICNDGNYESPSVGYELDGYSVKLRRADNTYENTDTPIIYLSLSKDYNGQDHLVLSVNSAEELLACNGEQERKAYLLKCEVSYSEEAECYGIIRHQTTKIICSLDICNDGSYSSEVGYKLDGYSVVLRQSENQYENTNIPIVYIQLSKEYKDQDHLVLSANCAEELLACNGEQERKAYLLKCEVSYSEEAECYGIIRHQTTKIICSLDICNDGSYSSEVGYKLDGYSVVLRQSENQYENTNIPIVYIQLSKEYKDQDHLVLSANCAEELLACNGEQERKAYLLKCEVSYSEEAECYGIIRHQTTKIICSLDICNDGSYSPEVGYKLDGYSVLLRQTEDLYEGTNIPILYLQLSEDYNSQDHLVLSANCAEELLACNGEQERKAYLLKCEVIYSENAGCYGIIRPNNQ